MKNIVVIPALKRPELLALNLEKLHEADASRYADVHIYVDTCSDETLNEMEYVRNFYYPTAHIFRAKPHPEAPGGTWNILSSLKDGYRSGAEFIFLVEEDVAISKDYFNWHLRVWKEDSSGTLFASCGRLIARYGRDHYTNPGSCFHRSSVEKIVPHINNNFFSDRRGYMDSNFGSMDEASDLDDGLIRRVARDCGGTFAWPEKPVAFHQGFHAYRKFQDYQNEGAIQERIDNLRLMLPKIDPTARYTRDFEPLS
jgi:hypothetical protein